MSIIKLNTTRARLGSLAVDSPNAIKSGLCGMATGIREDAPDPKIWSWTHLSVSHQKRRGYPPSLSLEREDGSCSGPLYWHVEPYWIGLRTDTSITKHNYYGFMINFIAKANVTKNSLIAKCGGRLFFRHPLFSICASANEMNWPTASVFVIIVHTLHIFGIREIQNTMPFPHRGYASNVLLPCKMAWFKFNCGLYTSMCSGKFTNTH